MFQNLHGIPLETEGGVPVNLQDQHTEMVVIPLHIEINSGALLAAPLAVDDTTISLNAGHGAAAGNILVVKEGAHYYFGTILSFAVDVATMDTPVDHVLTTGASVCVGDSNLNKSGTLATPVVAHLAPVTEASWDITRLHVSITDNVAMDSGKFGGIAALTNGVVLRAINGNSKNIANAKTNGDLALYASAYEYDPKAPAGVYGFMSHHVFGGQPHVGVVLRIIGQDNDRIEVLIQDDLTALTAVRVVAIGHVVEDDP